MWVEPKNIKNTGFTDLDQGTLVSRPGQKIGTVVNNIETDGIRLGPETFGSPTLSDVTGWALYDGATASPGQVSVLSTKDEFGNWTYSMATLPYTGDENDSLHTYTIDVSEVVGAGFYLENYLVQDAGTYTFISRGRPGALELSAEIDDYYSSCGGTITGVSIKKVLGLAISEGELLYGTDKGRPYLVGYSLSDMLNDMFDNVWVIASVQKPYETSFAGIAVWGNGPIRIQSNSYDLGVTCQTSGDGLSVEIYDEALLDKTNTYIGSVTTVGATRTVLAQVNRGVPITATSADEPFGSSSGCYILDGEAGTKYFGFIALDAPPTPAELEILLDYFDTPYLAPTPGP
jgi:hypothetical protein